jgi:hypothetical protein
MVLLRGAAVALVLGGGVLFGVGAGPMPAGGQEAPPEEEFVFEEPPASTTAELLQYGWWNKAQQSPAGGNPAPAPPGAPSDGLFIAYEPAGGPVPTPAAGVPGLVPVAPAPAPNPVVLGPEAFGAVRYSVPPGAEASLTLKFTPTSTTQPGGVNPDAGTLSACPVSTSWDPVQNGRYDAAPKYDCTIGVIGVTAGDTVSFSLAAALATDGVFDLALVPSGNQPYKLAFEAPTSSSMALTSVPESEGLSSEGEFDASGFEDPAAEFFEEQAADGAFGVDDFGGLSVDEFGSGELSDGGFATTAAAGSGGPRVPGQVAVPAAVARNPFRPDASRTERMMALSLLLLLAVGLWWVGGKPVRPPRLLGSLGAGIPLVSDEVRTGGIGRFARVRPNERPPRLY